jgi:hypothetical protein
MMVSVGRRFSAFQNTVFDVGELSQFSQIDCNFVQVLFSRFSP